jgi:CspA family cold shock protein
MMRGRVHHWDVARRFGKITGDDGRVYFVHRDDLTDVLALTPGQRVTFEPIETDKGPRAANVRPLDSTVVSR